MLVFEEHILELIPQRPPMVMIDRLLNCDEKQVVTCFFIKSDNLFADQNGFSASGVMENMAQTAAARTGYLLKNQSDFPNKKVPVGVIGSIKNFRLHFRPKAGETLQTTIVVEHEVLMATVVKGIVETEGKLVAEAELQIYLTEEQAES
jgi:3-hydroxymyristoyl/3-hydroxydecanoyl-(acyl carrier protein) dehydratase